MKKKVVNQPTRESEKLQRSIINNDGTDVVVRGHTFKVRWIHRHTLQKVTDIALADGNDLKASCQTCAAIILNNYWKIKFLYWFLWRWFYYVKEYTDEELMPILDAAQKKSPLTSYYQITTYLIGMKTTMMAMTKEEVNRILQGQTTDGHGKSAKTDHGSPNP